MPTLRVVRDVLQLGHVQVRVPAHREAEERGVSRAVRVVGVEDGAPRGVRIRALLLEAAPPRLVDDLYRVEVMLLCLRRAWARTRKRVRVRVG